MFVDELSLLEVTSRGSQVFSLQRISYTDKKNPDVFSLE